MQDVCKIKMSGEKFILNEIDDLGCEQFLKSKIVVKSCISSTCFLIQVESQICVEQKAAFAMVETSSENEFHEFFNDLKLWCSVHACDSIAEFISVVLDDTRLHLKSFIHKNPDLDSIHNIMLSAELQSKSISWFIRETWSEQIINAVSSVHSQNLKVGSNFHSSMIGIRADESAVLSEFKTSVRHIHKTRG